QPKTQNVFKLHRPSEDFAQTAARQAAPRRAEATKQRLTESYGRLPLSFEANQGQTSNEVKFLSRGGGYTLFLTSNEAVLDLRKASTPKARSVDCARELFNRFGRADQLWPVERAVVRMKLVGANPNA